jgi:sugar lactone lactonase YvrE
MPRWLFCLIILLCNAPGAYALNPNKVLTQYVRQVWTASDGLPLNAIFTITQTRDGYIWVGTHEGLARFDGIHFTTFNRQNTPILNNNRITVLCEAPSGALWIGTGGDRFFSSGGVRGGGLFRYDQGRWQCPHHRPIRDTLGRHHEWTGGVRRAAIYPLHRRTAQYQNRRPAL